MRKARIYVDMRVKQVSLPKRVYLPQETMRYEPDTLEAQKGRMHERIYERILGCEKVLQTKNNAKQE